SLNQIAKAYGESNSILDNCHVRVAFSTNDERTARRISDSLGTATEMRAMKNYAGHRLSPWLGHLMVSRQETARPLLTPGEVMQLPPDEALVQVSGVPPIRATKVRYFLDPELAGRVADPPTELKPIRAGASSDWTSTLTVAGGAGKGSDATADEGGHRIEPEFEGPIDAVPAEPAPEAWLDFEQDTDESVQAEQNRRFRAAARQASLDPDDGIPL
ncbi:MAG TPA: type IV secretory system conjugative DNA transfer family protein, partial [Caulobacter sp.]|nr:type IV secretory system conjugative DNA transfer family protein [Caulobacter sp.]